MNRRQCDLGPVARFDRHARTLSTLTERKRAWTSKSLLDRCGELITSYPISEMIPYETVFISPNQRLTRKEIGVGQDSARRRGWVRTAR